MVNNYFNPYMSSYGQQYQGFQQQSLPQQVTKVNGENGARAYQLAPNSSALLLDECGTIVWLKTTDGGGYATVSPYDISPHKTVQQIDISSLETRISRLEEMINERSTDTTTVARKASKSASSDSTKDSAS